MFARFPSRSQVKALARLNDNVTLRRAPAHARHQASEIANTIETSSAPTGRQSEHHGWSVQRDFSGTPLYSRGRNDARHATLPDLVPGSLQRKLAVGASDDPLEHEADRIADGVMRIATPDSPTLSAPSQVSRQGDQGASEPIAHEAPASVRETLISQGQPLDAGSRDFFEPRFGVDFSHVRVHADSRAAESARAVNARAYAVGSDLVFGAGAYAPSTTEGKRLIAHELAHVMQSRSPEVIRRDDRHNKGHGGEQNMGFGYRQDKGWIIVEGPSGAAGHGITAPGFDGIAYNIQGDELHILDNKALKATTARSASALTTNVLKNLDDAIAGVRAMQDLPSRIKILGLLQRARAAIAAGTPLPKNVKLVITGAGGNVQRVSGRLAGQGVEFREAGTLDEPLAPATPPARQTQGTINNPSPKTPPPAGNKKEPSVVVDPSLTGKGNPTQTKSQGGSKSPATPDVEAPAATGGAKTPAPKVTGPARQPGRFTGLGVTIGASALSLAFGLLSSYIKAWVYRKIADKQINANQVKAQQVINQQLDVALKMMLSNPEQQLYARVYMSSATISTIDVNSPAPEPSVEDSAPIIDLTGIGFTFDPLLPEFSDTLQQVQARGHGWTTVRLLVGEIPLETPSIENLIALAKARKLPLDELRYFVLGRFAGLDDKGDPKKYIDAVNRWQHILALIDQAAPKP